MRLARIGTWRGKGVYVDPWSVVAVAAVSIFEDEGEERYPKKVDVTGVSITGLDDTLYCRETPDEVQATIAAASSAIADETVPCDGGECSGDKEIPLKVGQDWLLYDGGLVAEIKGLSDGDVHYVIHNIRDRCGRVLWRLTESNFRGKYTTLLKDANPPGSTSEPDRKPESSGDSETPCDFTHRANCLDEAKRLVTGDRNRTYGDPIADFRGTAAIWTAYLTDKLAPGVALEPHDVAAMMVGLKVSRLRVSPGKDDNWVDIAGYAACGMECANLEGKDQGEQSAIADEIHAQIPLEKGQVWGEVNGDATAEIKLVSCDTGISVTYKKVDHNRGRSALVQGRHAGDFRIQYPVLVSPAGGERS